MNYPVWSIPSVGGSLLIAIISIVHVYVAHFAVGGGLFLVLTEMKGYREDSPKILEYTRRHAKFFLLLTMVFGSITGVGIWFIISVVHPAATSVLIHGFVFGWATEWVFFVGEIVSLFVYYYTFGKMERRTHLLVGWLYFVFAWLSLVVINGIVCFMLTPGQWIDTGNFWAGIFNPTYFPSLFFRTFISLMLAGLFGFLTSAALKEKELRKTMVRYCARWLLLPVLFMPLLSYWYLNSIGDVPKNMVMGGSPEIIPFMKVFIWVMPALFAGGLVMSIRLPRAVNVPLAYLLLVAGILYMGSFEWIREAARRPYVIHGFMYSTGALKSDVKAINREGVLGRARWVRNRVLTKDNMRAAGREIFHIQCLPCHTVGGMVNDILPRTEKYGLFGMDAYLSGMGRINAYMPPFMGTQEERKALAAYIVHELHKKPAEAKGAVTLEPMPVAPPEFDPKKDAYVLLAWNDTGMHCITDNYKYFNILPPGNTIRAQLIRRGEAPELVTEGVELSYEVEQGFENPSRHVGFWKYSKALFGRSLEQDRGLEGNATAGAMEPDEDGTAFIAGMIPVVPYSKDGDYNPYPIVSIEARDGETDKVLAKTKCVAPASTEMGCRTCHGGGWRVKDAAGLSDQTAQDILSVHDRMSGTQLFKQAQKGRPRLCQDCHADPILNAKGRPDLLNLSAAIHGLHANYLTGRDAEACHSCHPASQSGRSRCFRGVHAQAGLTCLSCHGTMEDHALSLLLKEQQAGKPGAVRLMRHLRARLAEDAGKIHPRTPWVNEPDCLGCHLDYMPPEKGTIGFNKWTEDMDGLYRMRTGESGILCQACHGNTHAIYPAENPYGKDRDVLQPMQYQGNSLPVGANRNCRVCHTVDMEDEMHHPNMLRMFRGTSRE